MFSRYTILTLMLVILTMTGIQSVAAHSGGTNAAGCHNDHQNGGYHCH
jgi:hypothetical protein